MRRECAGKADLADCCAFGAAILASAVTPPVVWQPTLIGQGVQPCLLGRSPNPKRKHSRVQEALREPALDTARVA